MPTDPAQVSVSMVTNQGHIGLLLANNESPCTVNSFASLAGQKFFDDTKCHRLATDSSILQCGDPSADGTGGPGYQVRQRVPDRPIQAGRPGAPRAGDLSAGHLGDGQQRAEHQRQPVLPGVQGHSPAARIHRLRQNPAGRAGHPGQDRQGRRRRWRCGRTAGHRSHHHVDTAGLNDETHPNRSRARASLP